jgi:hypothetical protein
MNESPQSQSEHMLDMEKIRIDDAHVHNNTSPKQRHFKPKTESPELMKYADANGEE